MERKDDLTYKKVLKDYEAIKSGDLKPGDEKTLLSK